MAEQYGCSKAAVGWMHTPDLEMHYLDWGGDGPPLVALHGLSSSCHWYDLVMPHLTDAFHCVAPDQRAHGKTDQPSSGYDWQTFSQDIISLLDHLGLDQVALMGHSWGANVALSVAARHSERVSNLVLVDGGFFGRRMAGTSWEDFKRRLSQRDIYGPSERYLGILREQLEECWSEELEHIVMTMPYINPDGTLEEYLKPANHEQVLWAMFSEPASTCYPLVRCPTLLVATEPRTTGPFAEFADMRREGVEATQVAISNCQVNWIPDSMHDIGYYQPVELAHAIRRFLGAAEK